jgi:butyryl-CoA dehydrogenase
MLLASKSYVEGGLALCLYAARLVDEQATGETAAARAEATALLDLLTPVVKAWPAVYCLEASSLAIQVHGGYGYTREYPVEQLYRDNRLNAIHEGTNGIQALDLLGRKAVADGGAALEVLTRAVAADVERAAVLDQLRPLGGALVEALGRGVATARAVGAVLPRDPERALANATPFLEAFGHVTVAWMWLRQATAAARALPAATGPDVDFYEGKLAACRFFFAHELPRVVHLFGLAERMEPTAAQARPEWL